ncbi:MAG: tetratricopeptide repeat protein [Scytonema sp. PMC 1069.18]|nr:tetratricopeptide repeat protein [Scytonema sp. PMC 1069.18]MEC4879788.1 tetratricopeptide repeat protein [Scytonema sp. PMC 1070.18]
MSPLLSRNAYFWRGVALYKIGEHKGAIDNFDSLIKIEPNEFRGYNSRGLARSALKDSQGAIEDFNQAINISMNASAAAYHNRGFTHHEIGNVEESIKDYNQSIESKKLSECESTSNIPTVFNISCSIIRVISLLQCW